MWSKFFRTPLSICFLEGEGGGTAGGGADAGTGGSDGQGTGGEGGGAGTGGTEGSGGGVSNEAASAAIRAEKAKIKESYKHHEAIVNRISKATGLTPDQIAARLEAQQGLTGGGVPQQTPGMPPGMTPEVLQYFGGISQSIRATQAETKRLERQLEESKLKSDTRYADWDQVKTSVEEYAEKYGTNLETAYWAVNGAKRAEQLAREAEQRAIANREQYGYLGVVAGDTPAGAGGMKYDNADQALIGRAFSMEPDEYKALSGEKVNIDDYERYLAKKNAKR